MRADIVAVYVEHVIHGKPLRQIARERDAHPSTVMRQVRRAESWNEDPLQSEALSVAIRNVNNSTAGDSEALRVLRRLAEKDAVLVVSTSLVLATACVFKMSEGINPIVIARTPRATTVTMLTHGWIRVKSKGATTNTYVITKDGSDALRSDIAERSSGRKRINTAETPLDILCRKRDLAGKPYLTDGGVQAAFRFREDWASDRTAAELAITEALGAGGLSEVVLRVVCLEQNLTVVEQALGWSARSAKVVLRIALQRLESHYASRQMAA